VIADELNAFRAAGFRDTESGVKAANEKATFWHPEKLSDNFSDKKWRYSDNYQLLQAVIVFFMERETGFEATWNKHPKPAAALQHFVFTTLI
jgi:hypothetical protein